MLTPSAVDQMYTGLRGCDRFPDGGDIYTIDPNMYKLIVQRWCWYAAFYFPHESLFYIVPDDAVVLLTVTTLEKLWEEIHQKLLVQEHETRIQDLEKKLRETEKRLEERDNRAKEAIEKLCGLDNERSGQIDPLRAYLSAMFQKRRLDEASGSPNEREPGMDSEAIPGATTC